MSLPKNLICIGASAGGLQAVTDLLHAIPASINDKIAIILAQHLSPTYKSRLSELLSRETNLAVVETTSDEKLEAGKMYICPPDREIYVESDTVHLTKSPIGIGPKPSVDSFLSSVSSEWAKSSVAVILSGTGSDGSRGVEDLSDRGGVIMVQHPKSAKYDGMPHAAISTNLIDYIGTPEGIGDEIVEFVRTGKLSSKPVKIQTQDKDKSAFYQILRLLSQRTGTDFSNYKSATINRRLEKRLSSLQITSLKAYVAHCQNQPKEIDALFDSVLIGVTEFFRDYPVFERLKGVLEKRFENDKTITPIRIWIPGCATGEEAYSIGMLISEVLGLPVAQKRVQIFASDIDEVALRTARSGLYSQDKLEKLPNEYKKYLKPKNNNQFQVTQDIKSFILFSKHDVTANPPFLKLDLISCRNLLIYFDMDLQKHVMPIFHYSLKETGIMLLGKSETTGPFSEYFATIDSKLKLYRKKKSRANDKRIPQTITNLSNKEHQPQEKKTKNKTLTHLIKGSFFSQSVNPIIIINEDMDILEVVGDINDYVKIKPGQMTSNLVHQVVDGIQIEVRSSVLKSIKSNAVYTSRFKKAKIGEKYKYIRVIVKPVKDDPSNYESLLTVEFESIDLEDIGVNADGEQNDDRHDQRIIELERELNATKEDLQAYVEELETANEELQSLNEELQSSNEELQSTNEELETSNEELQSTNEEVQIAYTELSELNNTLLAKELKLTTSQQQLNALLENTVQVYVLVSADYRIITFNQSALETFQDLFDKVLIAEKNLVDYLSNEILERFFESFRKAISGVIVKEDWRIKNRTGQEKHFFINLHPVKNDEGAIKQVVIGLLDVTDKVVATQALTKAERLNQSIYAVLGTAIVVSDENQVIVEVNEAFTKTFGYNKKQIVGNHINLIASPVARKDFDNRYQSILSKKSKKMLLEEAYDKHGNLLHVKAQSRLLEIDQQKLVVTSIDNITDLVDTNKRLLHQQEDLNKTSRDLNERIKEKNTLLNISLLGSQSDNIREIIEKSVDFVAQGFQFPDNIGVCMVYEEEKYATPRFRNIKSNALSTPILIDKVKIGELIVCYQKKINGSYPSFYTEEIALVEALGNLLSQIFENKRLTRKIEQSENFLQSTLASVREAISIVDKTGKHILVNDPMIQMTGFTREELMSSTTPHLYWPEEEYDEIENAFSQTIGNENGSFELTFKRRNGERFPVLISPSAIKIDQSKEEYFISIVQDISEQKTREQALMESESNYRFIYENTLDLICRHSPEGVYEEVSPSSKWITGYEPSELIGKDPYKSFHPDDIDRIREESHQVLLAQDGTTNIQYRFKHKKGHYTWMETYNRLIKDEKGKTIGILASTRDISNQKKQEERLSNLIEALRVSNDELKQFAYVASHDLQEPLRMISGFTQLLHEKYSDKIDEEANKFINYVVDGSNRLQTMINDLLQYSRVNTTELVVNEVNVSDTMDHVQKLLLNSIEEKKAAIKIGKLPTIKAISGLIERLMLNLVNNALKYNGNQPPKIEIKSRDRKDHWEFEVKDHGIGIEPKYYEHIFVIFKRLHDRDTYKGTGIGLAVCKRIVLKHGGKIWVESEPGKGSSFFFSIPKEPKIS